MINSHCRYKTDQFKYSNKLFTSSDIVNALESAQIHLQNTFNRVSNFSIFVY